MGKSTLAKQISHLTGALYIDLASADPVGGNTLSGGLVKSGTFGKWSSNEVAVLIDGLDEARLKVTQQAFEAFLSDVAEISSGRRLPTILFGRTGAVQDSWLALEGKTKAAVLEIGYYPPEDALEFAFSRVSAKIPKSSHLQNARRALEVLLQRLRNDTADDGDRFAGYAPVLQAVADRVAEEGNPQALIAQVEKGQEPVTLSTVVSAILEREQTKIGGIPLTDKNLYSILYTPDEQIARLASRVYQVAPPDISVMNPQDAQVYATALQSWLPDHPFLDGNVRPASAVFDAAIAAVALKNSLTRKPATDRELAKGAAANPFLADFYIEKLTDNVLPPEHIGVLYASMRSRLSLGDSASLSIEGFESEDETERLRTSVEVSVMRHDTQKVISRDFESEQSGTIRLGNHVEDVEISALSGRVEIGLSNEVILVAPVSIQCGELSLNFSRLIAEPPPNDVESMIFLEAGSAETSSVLDVPVVNGRVRLSVSWPGASSHPWTSFSVSPTKGRDERVDEALRRFRKFVMSFRSHSKGSLKRLAAKLDHDRMTKGTGRLVLDRLLARGVITLDGAMYTLHPDALARETATSYRDCVSRMFSTRAVEFVEAAIKT